MAKASKTRVSRRKSAKTSSRRASAGIAAPPRKTTAARNQLLYPTDAEIVVLTDKSASGAILATPRSTTALSAEATRILRASWMEETPAKLPMLMRAQPPQDAEFAGQWIDEMVGQGLFRLSAATAQVRAKPAVRMKAGQAIKLSKFGTKRTVSVEYAGTLETRVVGRSTIYWYTSDVMINGPMLGLRNPAAATMPVPMSADMRIRRMPGGVGVNCNVCAACGGCGGCGFCGLCGGLNLGAGILATVAVDATLGLTNVARAFEMLRAR